MEEMTGFGVTVKFVLEVAVIPATVTEIGPVDALPGTLTTSAVLVAEETEAGAPLNCTVFAEGVVLKPCPRIVTTVEGPPWLGLKPRMLNVPELPTVRLI